MKILNNNNKLRITIPPWACEWGNDHFGTWMTLSILNFDYKFRWIPPGTTVIGDNRTHVQDCKPEHFVHFEIGFWIGETTVSKLFWSSVERSKSSDLINEQHPMVFVSWSDVQSFIENLNIHHPYLHLSLPNEYQWEYACRAGQNTRYFFGDRISREQAHFRNEHGTIAIKEKPKNKWGLYQMHGNVWEWCNNSFDPNSYKAYQKHQKSENPIDSNNIEFHETDLKKAIRGGGWYNKASLLSSGFRRGLDKDFSADDLGFRLYSPAHNPEKSNSAAYNKNR